MDDLPIEIRTMICGYLEDRKNLFNLRLAGSKLLTAASEPFMLPMLHVVLSRDSLILIPLRDLPEHPKFARHVTKIYLNLNGL